MGQGLRRTSWLLGLALWALPAQAGVVRLHVARTEPYASGKSFGAVGPYRRLLGRATFAVDPVARVNQAVIDLALAPKNPSGRVEFSVDFEILAPEDLTKAGGTLLYDVNNRGNRTCLGMFNTGADDFLMRRGVIIAWSGWIGEVLPGGERLTADLPRALVRGNPLRGLVRAEMAPNAPAERLNIAQWDNMGSYRPTPEGISRASLTWRLREADARIPIPPGQWRLESREVESDGQKGLLPEVTCVLAGGFRPGYLYELVYEAEGSLIQGLGLAGIRDLVSYLRRAPGPGNPLAGPSGRSVVSHTVGFGVSQSGRCLRQFLYDGFNEDEEGKKVFDGLLPHVAGAGMGFFNHRFASPTRHNSQHDNHLYPADVFPFTYGDEKDPFTGRTDGLMVRARARGVMPRVIHTQTSAEYWHRAGSLVHTDPLGKRDSVIPPEVRIYAIGGAQHGAGTGIPGARGQGQLAPNPTNYRPILRALLAALDDWIRGKRPPPPSRHPTLAARTLGSWQETQSAWRALPGVRYPQVIQRPEFLDHGPYFTAGRILSRLPPARKGAYGVLVPMYGLDGNELGMLLPPSITVPIGTYTGWNLRSREIGAENELLSLAGGFIPFPRTAEERRANGDPRLSLSERYRTRSAYLDTYARAARQLAAERFLLEEDVPRELALAEKLSEVLAPAN